MLKLPDKSPILEFNYKLRSRYSETDKMGYVYYGHYLAWFEAARTEMIRSYGFSYRNMEDDGIMLPVIHTELEYKSPVFYDEEVSITVKVFDVPSVRLQTYYEVSAAERDVLCVIGEVSLVFIDSKTRRPRRAPEYFIMPFKKEEQV
jgi:acyl-CoA thioester hydrolase